MKKKLAIMCLASIFLFVGCSKDENAKLDTNNITVSENGEFSISGHSKKNSSFYVNDSMITSSQQDDDGNFVLNVKMDTPIQSADFKIKYLNDELLDETIEFDTSKYENAITQSSIDLENEKKQKAEEKKTKAEEQKKNSDISSVSSSPTSEQKDILNELTDQQFKKTFPYKGSKIKSVLGIIQDWTENDGRWFYKADAVITNEYGAKKDVNLEVYITPNGADSGYVEFVDY